MNIMKSLCVPAVGLLLFGFSPQDQDLIQRHTALVRVYPRLDQITTAVDALVKEGKFGQALSILMDAAESHPNHLVPVPDPDRPGGPPMRYIGVIEYGRRQIASWVASGAEARAAVSAYF